MLGELAQALDSCEQALQLARESSAQHAEASALGSLGFIHYKMGNYPEALRYYWDSLHARRMKGDYFLQADVFTRLGDTHLAMGEPAAAQDLWKRALVILDDLAHRDAAGVRARLQTLDSQDLIETPHLEHELAQ